MPKIIVGARYSWMESCDFRSIPTLLRRNRPPWRHREAVLQCQFSIWRRCEEVRRHVHERRCLIAEDGTVAALRYDPQRRSRDRA